MSTGYPLPPDAFNAAEFARNKVLRANQGRASILDQYLSMFSDFWGVTEPGKGSRHTSAEMQAIINIMPQATALQMLHDSNALRDFIQSVAPGAIPVAYMDTAFEATVTNSTIVIGDLRPAWQVPVEEAS
jgi:hypothetical protein